MADDRKADKTDAELKKLRQAEDGRKAMLDYEAQAAAIRAKTERLRALRLARDAASPPKVKAPAKTKSTKSAKAKAQPLSEWLNDQKKDGLQN
jgi:hypothetical protein